MQSRKSIIPLSPCYISLILQTAVLGGDGGGLGVDAAELDGVAVGQGVHGLLADVEAVGGGVDAEDEDLVAVVLEAPALAAVGRVPGDAGGAADEGEVGDVGLLLPAEARHEAVLAVGAGELGEGAVADVVAGVVGDYTYSLSVRLMSRGGGRKDGLTSVGSGDAEESGEGKDGGDLHFECVWRVGII